MNPNEENKWLGTLKQIPEKSMPYDKKEAVLENVIDFEQKWARKERAGVWMRRISAGIGISVATAALALVIFTDEGRQWAGGLLDRGDQPSIDRTAGGGQNGGGKPGVGQPDTKNPKSGTPDNNNPDPEPKSLTFTPVENKVLTPTEMTDLPIKDSRIIPIPSLGKQKSLKVQLILPADTEYRAYLIDENDLRYDLGTYGNYEVNPDIDKIKVTVEQREDIGAYLKIVGGGGATTQNIQYVRYDEAAQQWTQWDMTNVTEEDVNHDGKPLLVVTSRGSIPSYVTILRWNGQQFETANVAESIGEQYAQLLRTGDKAWIEAGTDNKSKVYQYVEGQLVPVSDDQALAIRTMDSLLLHVSEDYVVNRFGGPSEKLTDAMNDEPLWRYDIQVAANYKVLSDGSDTVDLKGIKVGKIHSQMFVSWSEDQTAQGYSYYYKNEQDEVVEYRLRSDGTATMKVINF